LSIDRTDEREGVERRLIRRIDLRANIAARDGIGGAVEDAPLGQRLDVVLVESEEAGFRKSRRRAQLTGAERRQPLARALNVICGLCESLGQWPRPVEAYTLDLETGQRAGAA
jgi:hypothetical protein